MIEHGIHEPFMITFLYRMRRECKVLEDRDAAYKSGLSLGDDLENFIIDIKNNNHRYENLGLGSEEKQDYFIYSMLTPSEEKKLEFLDEEFLLKFINLNPDISKDEMAKSDSNKKYAYSRGSRVTYII